MSCENDESGRSVQTALPFQRYTMDASEVTKQSVNQLAMETTFQ